MSTKFDVGDHVRWNSEAGHMNGRIIQTQRYLNGLVVGPSAE
jgi:hypothetical protein